MANAGRLRGFVGQRMAAKAPNSRVPAGFSRGPGSGTITLPSYPCTVEVWLWGGGGGTGGGQGGAGGAAATYKRFRNQPGYAMAYIVGAGGSTSGSDGGDSTITVPGGKILTAGGGKGVPSGDVGFSGGVATNGDLNRNGGRGGAMGAAGAAGDHGGAGGAGATGGGGGGAGGFGETPDLFFGGSGAGAAPSAAPGVAPGGGAGATSSAGGDGHLYVICTRIT
jgi:hypothetical protein